MTDQGRAGALWLHAQLEDALRHIGGADLVDHARAEARRYADLRFPGDPTTDLDHESLERLHARLHVLTDRLDRARSTVTDVDADTSPTRRRHGSRP